MIVSTKEEPTWIQNDSTLSFLFFLSPSHVTMTHKMTAFVLKYELAALSYINRHTDKNRCKYKLFSQLQMRFKCFKRRGRTLVTNDTVLGWKWRENIIYYFVFTLEFTSKNLTRLFLTEQSVWELEDHTQTLKG